MNRMHRSNSRSFHTTVRRALDDAGNARPVSVTFDFEAHADDLLWALREIAARTSPVSKYRLRIASHVVSGDTATPLLDALASTSPHTRSSAAEACGLLRIEAAVPTLGLLLGDRVRRVRRAAAEALGRIGGYRAADELLRGLRKHRLPTFWLVLALVRAVPDHYVESRLGAETDPRLTNWLALAAGIHNRKTARPYLIALLASDDDHARTVACRALGWIGDPADRPALRAALEGDGAPEVREAAARALRRFHDPEAKAFLESIAAADRHVVVEQPRPRVAYVAPLPAAAAPTHVEDATVALDEGSSSDVADTWRIWEVKASPAPEPQAVPAPVIEPAVMPQLVVEPTREPVHSQPRVEGPSRFAQTLAWIRGANNRHAPERPVELPPLTPRVMPKTPHFYRPDPSLMDDDVAVDERSEAQL